MGKKETAAAAARAAAKAKAAGHDSGSSSSGSGGSRVQHLSAKQHRKKGDDGSKKSWSSFNAQLRPLGLCLRSIGGDGNCLFRALADQLSGSQDRHADYRAAVVDYLRRHPSDFAPFVWDMTFEQYCAKMARSGEWGGAAELAAAGRCYAVHIVVHQHNAPRLLNVYDPNSVTIDAHNSDAADMPLPVTRDTRTIHLAYHDGEHYSSVRNISDANSTEPATPIVIVEGASAASAACSSSSSPSLTQQETIVMQSTACKNLAKVRQLLRENWNDADAVVEILYAEVQMGLDIDVDLESLESLQRAEIEAQRREEEDKAAAARVQQLEREQREKEREEQMRTASQRAAEDAQREVEQRKGGAVQPAADDCAESDSEGDGGSDHGEANGDSDGSPDADGVKANGDGASAAAVPSAAAASASAPTSSSASSSRARPPGGSGPSAPPKRISGRDKKVAAKLAKMMADKLKRQNKGQVKKERAQADQEQMQAINDQLGTVRI